MPVSSPLRWHSRASRSPVASSCSLRGVEVGVEVGVDVGVEVEVDVGVEVGVALRCPGVAVGVPARPGVLVGVLVGVPAGVAVVGDAVWAGVGSVVAATEGVEVGVTVSNSGGADSATGVADGADNAVALAVAVGEGSCADAPDPRATVYSVAKASAMARKRLIYQPIFGNEPRPLESRMLPSGKSWRMQQSLRLDSSLRLLA